MIDLFYKCEENDIANNADDTTPCSCGTDIPTVISELQGISAKVFNWFGIIIRKPIQVNVTYYLVLKLLNCVYYGIQIISSTSETLLGITIDSKLIFENHLSAICNKVSRKINALGWITNYMSLEKRRTMIKTFIESH